MKSIFVFATIISYLSQPEVDNFNHALFRIKDLGFSEYFKPTQPFYEQGPEMVLLFFNKNILEVSEQIC